MKIGILTSGGDAPGLNAVIRGAVLKGTRVDGHEFVGFVGGYKGLCEADIMPLTRHEVKGISKEGGTILGTSRTNPFDFGGVEQVKKVLRRHPQKLEEAEGEYLKNSYQVLVECLQK